MARCPPTQRSLASKPFSKRRGEKSIKVMHPAFRNQTNFNKVATLTSDRPCVPGAGRRTVEKAKKKDRKAKRSPVMLSRRASPNHNAKEKEKKKTAKHQIRIQRCPRLTEPLLQGESNEIRTEASSQASSTESTRIGGGRNCQKGGAAGQPRLLFVNTQVRPPRRGKIAPCPLGWEDWNRFLKRLTNNPPCPAKCIPH